MKMIYIESKLESMISVSLKSGKVLRLEKGLNKMSVEEAEELGEMPSMKHYIDKELLIDRPEVGCIENRGEKSEVVESDEDLSDSGDGETGDSSSDETEGEGTQEPSGDETKPEGDEAQ